MSLLRSSALISLSLVVAFFVYLSCDKGENITDNKPPEELQFPNQTTGGDPTGNWNADSVAVALVDSSLLDLMEFFGVDSFTYTTALEGFLNINADSTYSTNCILYVDAMVWTTTPTDSVVLNSYAGGDTLISSGTVGREIENVLVFDFGETFFRIDTLAYTAHNNQLMLVTLPYGLQYENLTTIDLYFVLYFSRIPGTFAFQNSLLRNNSNKGAIK